MKKKEEVIWSENEYYEIADKLIEKGCKFIKHRSEYVCLKEVVKHNIFTEVSKFGKNESGENPVKSKADTTTVNWGICNAKGINDSCLKNDSSDKKNPYFLAPLKVENKYSFIEDIPSLKAIRSEKLSLNIGLDTEFQKCTDDSDEKIRLLLSVQMSLVVGPNIIRYFFIIDPRYQEITAEGGKIPLKFFLADIMEDFKKNYCPNLPKVLKKNIVYKEKECSDNKNYKTIDFKAMKNTFIPVTLICHTGKADLSVFRRSNYDVDILRKLSEIQGGCMSLKNIIIKAEADTNYNYYWLFDLSVRDTLGLTPAENKSLKELGKVIGLHKVDISDYDKENMAEFALKNPITYYQYAMTDSDIVVLFCTELFGCNNKIPMTLSSAAAKAMYKDIFKYLGVKNKKEFDRVYRGLEELNEGIIRSENDNSKFLKASRYITIKDNPDARDILEFFEEAYTGGFNASFYLGWITDKTIDFDLQNAYPTAMANIMDIDFSKPIQDFPRNYELSIKTIENPLTPMVFIGDFSFPDDCYCPNIPVLGEDGLKIYPLQGKNVHMCGPDVYLALQLGATVTVKRGFKCEVLKKEGRSSKCLAYAVSNLVKDRRIAKIKYPDKSLIEKTLKTMVCSCYGKTAQNVSPKTVYNARKMGRVDAEPSVVTSPYHAAYTTSLVRCILIGSINELHKMGYHIYSVTTDGFITDAPKEVLRSLKAYGFTQIFQEGRYILNDTREECDANNVWEAKHYNDVFLNITTRGNVSVNEEGVLAHNSFSTGEIKDSMADREAYIIAVLSREGLLKCSTDVWTKFSEIVEKKCDFQVSETFRLLSMNFDYKRCPVLETAKDTPIHYESCDGKKVIDTVIAEFDTRPYSDIEEFSNYRKSTKKEKCIKVYDDLERVKAKSTVKGNSYIGKNLHRKILMSILMGYRVGIYQLPMLDGLKQSEVVKVVNGWGISEITLNDWWNCSRNKRQENMLPYEVVEETLKKIYSLHNVEMEEFLPKVA